MSVSTSENPLEVLETRIGYRFVNSSLLVEAMTHRSFVNENAGATSNERLEHLGDAVLGLIVTDELFRLFDDDNEAEMTEKRKLLVNEAACAKLAESIELGRYLRLGHGEHLRGGRYQAGLLANAFEALVGAIHVDSERDFSTARSIVLRLYGPLSERLEEASMGDVRNANYKSLLQDLVQKHERSSKVPIAYELTDSSGPPHKPVISVTVTVEAFDTTFYGRGQASNKAGAEQLAAMNVLKQFKSIKNVWNL
jgi:ribonuclease-3